MRRLLTGLVTTLALGSMLVGCALVPQFACPAIGWINTVSVVLEGSAEDVRTVELCIEDTCSVRAEQLRQPDEPLQVVTAMPQETGSASTMPITPPIGSRVDDHTWTFSLMMNAPKAVTVRALSSDGATIAQREVTLNWKRVGGTKQCGGPVTTAPITLSIPG